MSKSTAKISVILPTYRGDMPDELAQAIESLADQTILPQELYIVKDGPLTNGLESVIDKKRTSSRRRLRLTKSMKIKD